MRNYFLLGGTDLEMVTIRQLLEQHHQPLSDAGLSWGAKASAYAPLLPTLQAQGYRPVFIELENDLTDPPPEALWIDHHNDRAGAEQPTALEQVFQLLQRPAAEWSRYYDLVVANDRGYLPALQQLGATVAEMQAIRAADRQAQGVTAADEVAALKALNQLEYAAEGALTVAYLPTSRTSPLVDRLDPQLGGSGYRNLLVVTPTELNFYGAGEWVQRLQQQWGGWSGGALPHYGFWGCSPAPPLEPLRQQLTQWLTAPE